MQRTVNPSGKPTVGSNPTLGASFVMFLDGSKLSRKWSILEVGSIPTFLALQKIRNDTCLRSIRCREAWCDLRHQFIRSVAQSGRALRLGRKGPGFKSLYSDQFGSLV